jgi:hypothetical protein
MVHLAEECALIGAESGDVDPALSTLLKRAPTARGCVSFGKQRVVF